jgi:hypothetical protein
MNMKTAEIANVVGQKIYGSPHGVKAVFVTLNEGWGIKMFRNRDDRDKIYNRQKIAASHGLGPITGGKVDLHDGEYQFGYVTEKLETLITPYMGNSDINWEEYDEAEEEYEDILEEMREELDEIGIGFRDNHCGNVGWKDGRLICIDFGED